MFETGCALVEKIMVIYDITHKISSLAVFLQKGRLFSELAKGADHSHSMVAGGLLEMS